MLSGREAELAARLRDAAAAGQTQVFKGTVSRDFVLLVFFMN
jgi:hypothetical protein